ncbi:hypothetical protein GOBAR_AA08658 [Gossypium barbadense]|uniref:SWIM-type domain-containing protein n=1 Tax=Gossypium barbadense TaxID=3634 RepID=A0A2P5Y8S0_GOSBA|nr:hypothetical protein GOBAR_AA08658 [Gossypium barbadense]
MQLLDDDDLGTMMEIWWSTGSENPQPVELFAKLADLEPVENHRGKCQRNDNTGEDFYQDVEDFSDPDVDEVPDDVDDKGPEELEELFVGQQFENKADCVFAIKQYSMKLSIDYKVVKSTPTLYVGECWRADDGCGWRVRAAFIQRTQQWQIRKLEGRHTCTVARYELEAHRFRHKLARLETDMAGSKPSLRQWLGSMEPWQWAQCFDEGYRYGHMTTNLVEAVNSVLRRTRHLPISVVFSATFYRRSGISPRSYGVDLRNRRCECGMFQTLRYPCAHVVAACAIYSLNVEQYIDDVYTLERTLHIWGNEFPVLRDMSTWEVQSPAFEMLPNRSLRRRVKGRPTTMRIRNDMDIREEVDPKRCTICRTVGHNRSKCPHGNVYTGQSSRSERN